ncbi:peptidase C26-domain-containing protein [Dunaliella salina]|uniref:folate gamma-glutamyl hydrolase n=1 Tax=Dunaliella salina TaxID=3046 RepID=A0ABQ7GM34_DUNSA|nr:peptidase C26-domain-containing protein [Dunaliella salina]|eukprot:KAF5835633.1 peptidase C26-domain-containing protein [Dunaliella salina]
MGVKASLLLLFAVSLFVSPSHAARIQKEGVHNLKQYEKDAPTGKKQAGTDRPLIGIMSQPCHDCPGKSYIAAAFVKWIEAAGGRPVPIRFYNSEAELYRIFKQLNGLVFPGGLTWLWLDSPYVLAARKLFQWAVQANDAGDPFPIHGTCLGFQLLHILASNVSRNDLLIETDSTSHATTLQFWNKQAAEESLLFGDMPDKLRGALESEKHNIVLQNHMYGLPPDMYKKYPLLSEWYNILSTSKDRNGIEYVSTIEGKKYPFFGTQWHPEKPPFESLSLSLSLSLEAIKVSHSLGSSFIETAKK